VNGVELFELAYAVRLYAQSTSFDASINRFRTVAGDAVDLTDAVQTKACLVWLNAWGCRQFSVEHHQAASAMLGDWWRVWIDRLPTPEADLDLLHDDQLMAAASAYGDLAQSEAGRRRLKGDRVSIVTVGPTGAAKVLHAVGPRAFPPLDAPIRRRLGLDWGPRGYLRYLRDVRDQVRALRKDAANLGLSQADVGAALGRPHSTLPKLIDEYNWVTITRGLEPPSAAEIATWHDWANRAS
jgi:hypothetical protein